VTDPKYAAFTALDPFFDIVKQGLAGLVDGDHPTRQNHGRVRYAVEFHAIQPQCATRDLWALDS